MTSAVLALGLSAAAAGSALGQSDSPGWGVESVDHGSTDDSPGARVLQLSVAVARAGHIAELVVRSRRREVGVNWARLVSASQLIAIVPHFSRSLGGDEKLAVSQGLVAVLLDRRPRAPAGEGPFLVRLTPGDAFFADEVEQFPWPTLVFLRTAGPHDDRLVWTDDRTCCLEARTELVDRVKALVRTRHR